MTSLSFFLDEKPICLDEISLLTLVIENKTMLFDYCSYLFDGFSGKEHFWKLEENGQFVGLDEKADFIPNFFHLDINSKRNINALYKLLKRLYYEELYDSINELKEKANSIIKEISMDFDIQLSVQNGIKEDDLFKVMNLQFSDEGLSKQERIIKYINVVNELRGTSLFFVINIHRFFEEKELANILKELAFRRIKVIDLEFENDFKINASEKVIVIDRELCLF